MINGPYQLGASPFDSLRPMPHGSGRRSLSASSDAIAASGGFRRVDLSRPGALSLDSQPGGGSQPARDRVGGALDESRQRAQQAPPRPDNDQSPAQADERARRSDAPASSPAPPTPRRDSDADGLPRPVTAGRTALLSGRAGVLAQLFGQDPGRDSVAIPSDRRPVAPSSPADVSPLRRGEAIETYLAVSRALVDGVGGRTGPGQAGMQILTDDDLDQGPVLDAVA